MRCLSRRIADGQVLSTVKQWLQVPVVERTEGGERRTTEAADKNSAFLKAVRPPRC